MWDKYCFLCGKNGTQDRLERHHIFGGAYRELSEKYNLVVYLCGNSCHRNGPKAAHQCAETMEILHVYGQKKAMKEQGWTVEQFQQIFGRNYLPNKESLGDNPSDSSNTPLQEEQRQKATLVDKEHRAKGS